MVEITMATTISRSDNIVVGLVDKDMMVANIENGKYCQLNETGNLIWELLESPKTVDELCNLLIKDFRVSKENCQNDIISFLKEMVDRKIVLICPGK
ncbi:MAG: PqqD family protein [Candidatus Riflebacteria bacterium]|nr:PqqD family protein [Candidatus Riflebacteria bacterium]